MRDISRNHGIVEQTFNRRRLVKTRIELEIERRRMAQPHLATDLTTQPWRGTAQGGDYRRSVATTQRCDEHRRIVQVRADAHFRYSDRHIRQVRVVRFAAHQDSRQRVAQFLADPQLTLAGRPA